MPEGPSIVILKELVLPFKGKKIVEVSGDAKVDKDLFVNQTVKNILSWGKHLLIQLPDCVIRIHLLLFGTYSINEPAPNKKRPRLALRFSKGAIYFYACNVQVLEGGAGDHYDWGADVMNDHWDPHKARRKLLALPDLWVCDALLDQNIFAGVGNIIKNEVLFRIRVHPETKVGDLPSRKLGEMIREARHYSFEFLEWKKANVLKKHWRVLGKKECPRCHIPVIKVQAMGKTGRRTFYCHNCQLMYTKGTARKQPIKGETGMKRQTVKGIAKKQTIKEIAKKQSIKKGSVRKQPIKGETGMKRQAVKGIAKKQTIKEIAKKQSIKKGSGRKQPIKGGTVKRRQTIKGIAFKRSPGRLVHEPAL